MKLVDELRAILTGDIDYDTGEKIRTALHNHAKDTYRPIHYMDYMEFMNDNECTFEKNHAQSKNHPYVWTLFAVKCQHVMGDCIEECLDNAIDEINRESN